MGISITSYNVPTSMRIRAKIQSLVDLALAIILSLYAALDLMWSFSSFVKEGNCSI